VYETLQWSFHFYFVASQEGAHRQDAACAGRFRSMPATNSGMLIGLARNG
jgi:hypothetical protein